VLNARTLGFTLAVHRERVGHGVFGLILMHCYSRGIGASRSPAMAVRGDACPRQVVLQECPVCREQQQLLGPGNKEKTEILASLSINVTNH
jgi:hypothetical protein